MSMVRLARAAVLAAALTALSAGTILAHSQTVDPQGNGGGFTKPISKAWAQAHCNAASPGVLSTTAAHAANAFTPAAALPCPAVPNPGGQVHGD
jgi:hypothetical protein